MIENLALKILWLEGISPFFTPRHQTHFYARPGGIYCLTKSACVHNYSPVWVLVLRRNAYLYYNTIAIVFIFYFSSAPRSRKARKRHCKCVDTFIIIVLDLYTSKISNRTNTQYDHLPIRTAYDSVAPRWESAKRTVIAIIIIIVIYIIRDLHWSRAGMRK